MYGEGLTRVPSLSFPLYPYLQVPLSRISGPPRASHMGSQFLIPDPRKKEQDSVPSLHYHIPDGYCSFADGKRPMNSRKAGLGAKRRIIAAQEAYGNAQRQVKDRVFG
jgi:hypothetical protein